jgi:hypothetical protein
MCRLFGLTAGTTPVRATFAARLPLPRDNPNIDT